MSKTDNQQGKPAVSKLSTRQAPEELPFDPSRFGAVEIPPELRARLLKAKLPRVPREQLEDTVPPRGPDKDVLDAACIRGRTLGALRRFWFVVAALAVAIAALCWVLR